jgi:tRNA(Ile)-lysidine synthase
VKVVHGLRPQSREEAVVVKRLAEQFGIPHRTVRWSGIKPTTGLQENARAARYRLLVQAAVRFGADRILTAHTRDDQAETVLMRMSRGSGLNGLGGMARTARVPGALQDDLRLLRPLLEIPKTRLVATLRSAGIAYADDPSNHDPRFSRARMRRLMPALAAEGLDAARLSQLARRLRRAEVALAAAADHAWASHAREHLGNTQTIVFGSAFVALPTELRLRLVARAIAQVGNEGAAELAKLEALDEAVSAAAAATTRLRRTLAGAVLTFEEGCLTVERAPARRKQHRRGEANTRRWPGRAGEALNHRPTLPPQSSQTSLE